MFAPVEYGFFFSFQVFIPVIFKEGGASLLAHLIKNLPANAGDARDVGSIPGSGGFPGKGNGNPVQYSGLESSIHKGGWLATVHAVAKSWTQLSTGEKSQCDNPRHSLPHNGQSMILRANTGQVHRLVLHILE